MDWTIEKVGLFRTLQRIRTREGKVRASRFRPSISLKRSFSQQGYCRLVLNYGLEKLVGNSPVCLDAGTPKSRDVYEHFGFQVRSLSLSIWNML